MNGVLQKTPMKRWYLKLSLILRSSIWAVIPSVIENAKMPGVYMGDRFKYWQLYCSHQRKDVKDPCEGVHIKYADLVELVRRDLNLLLNVTEEEMKRTSGL